MISWPPGVSALVAETPGRLADKKSYLKQIKNIIKCQLYTIASKKIDDYRLKNLNALFGIKLIFYDPI